MPAKVIKFPILEIILHKIRDEKSLKFTKMEFCKMLSPKKEMIGIAKENHVI
jgi:hypothetical protein